MNLNYVIGPSLRLPKVSKHISELDQKLTMLSISVMCNNSDSVIIISHNPLL